MAEDLNAWQADTFSRRRRLIKGDKDYVREFDTHYGKQGASGSLSRNARGAGKGDANRTGDSERYDIGRRLAKEDLTDEQRLELERAWYKLGGRAHPDDTDVL